MTFNQSSSLECCVAQNYSPRRDDCIHVDVDVVATKPHLINIHNFSNDWSVGESKRSKKASINTTFLWYLCVAVMNRKECFYYFRLRHRAGKGEKNSTKLDVYCLRTKVFWSNQHKYLRFSPICFYFNPIQVRIAERSTLVLWLFEWLKDLNLWMMGGITWNEDMKRINCTSENVGIRKKNVDDDNNKLFLWILFPFFSSFLASSEAISMRHI